MKAPIVTSGTSSLHTKRCQSKKKLMHYLRRQKLMNCKVCSLFLSSLNNALWQLFQNGRKPDLSSPAGGSGLQERIRREVERFLLKTAGVNQTDA